MDTVPGISLVPVGLLIVAGAAAWAFLSHRRRLGAVLTVVGLSLIAYAVAWTFLPE